MSSDSTAATGTYADQMAADLRRRIASGEFDTAGDKLPPDRELVEHYGRSRIVVQAALTKLRAEGLIYSRERFGSYVRRTQPVTVSASGAVTAAAADAGAARTEVQVHVLGGPGSQVPVPADVAARLKLPSGGVAVMRDRVCFLGDVPYMLLPSWYPEEVAAGTLLSRPAEQSGHDGGLLAAAGITATPGDDYLRARMATRAETAQLALREITPVIDWIRTFRDSAGRPVAVQRAVMPGDRAALAGVIS